VKTWLEENLEATDEAATKTYGDEKLVGANTTETDGIDDKATICVTGTGTATETLSGTADHELTTTLY
jgi:hypothetical protein